jgi:beta-galactosidase
MNADVWLNGEHLGDHPYGYTSFWFNLSGKLKFSEKNVLAVQVRNEGMNSRWYSGSGIYRHVWLKILEPVHMAQWGTYITTSEVNAKQAKVIIKTTVNNESSKSSEVTMVARIIDTKGIETVKAKSQNTIKPGTSLEFTQEILVESPVLWSIDTPVLYSAVIEVYSGKKLSDRMETKFGIRTVSFDAVNGFRLNGKTLKLKGGCVHHDNGPLGSKAFDRAEERRVELLKASSFNAIRCAHNPPSPAFLDACDRLGMLVIDEAFDMWHEGKNPQDYHLFFEKWWQKDAESMILRDRNHPSIILWSIGNEIPGMDKPEVANNAQMLAAFVHKMDPSRPVTAAVNSVSDSKDQYFAALDVCGYNYARNKYETDHLRKPERIMIATESYPLEAFDYWMNVLDYPWLTGDFVWTAFDYIGEASIGWLGYPQEKNFYPWNLAYCGDIDICGWKRSQSCYRDVLWNNGKVYVFVKPPEPSFRLNPKKETWSIWNWEDVVADWNWKGNEGKPLEVNVYSSCEQVKLFLNGKSLGKKTTNRASRYMAKWKVPYEAGILKVFGYMGDKQIDSSELRTAKQPSQIRMTADRTQIAANGQDLSYITVELLDMNGVRDPKAENLIKFNLEGPGTIAGVGNANPMSTESYLQPQRRAWQGRCLVVVKSDKKEGKLILKASVEGLSPAQLMINTKPDLRRE